jgi:hypothetical protein
MGRRDRIGRRRAARGRGAYQQTGEKKRPHEGAFEPHERRIRVSCWTAVMRSYFSINSSWSPAIGIVRDAVDRADLDALRGLVVADALGAQLGVDDVDLVALGYRAVRALGLAHVAVDAFVGNHQGHIVNSTG